jgi:mono/diheme cytochrome c family protein
VRWTVWPASILAAILAVACSGQPSVALTASGRPLPALDAAEVQTGQRVYQANCAVCHGANAQGAPNWATPGPDGLFPPPPHDDSGHTWHHSDRVLYESIFNGMNDPLRPGSPLRMPAFGGKLSDGDIRAMIEYFKSLWTVEHRQWQWQQTLNDFAPTPTPHK